VLGSYAISTEDINGVPPRGARAKTRTAEKRSVSVGKVNDRDLSIS
jgi:hypothetical protein